MIKLSDYFQPLNPATLLYYILLFFFFDILGTFIKGILLKGKKKDTSRIINWLIGLGFFVFVWFILGFYVPPQRTPLLISMAVLAVVSLPKYIKDKRHISFFKEIWASRVPILIISFFLPAVFVKASLPPYYSDEMAYHFISPSTLSELVVWKFRGGLFLNLPRLMNTFYILGFSLTRTYSVVRLINFTILSTSMIYAYKILKKNFGFLVSFLFVFIFYSLPQDIILTSTLGYVDVPAYSFLLIGVISAIDYLLNKTTDSLVLSFAFWGMALGTKYTGLTAFGAFLVSLVFILFLRRKEYKKYLGKAVLFRLAVAFFIFGGYWYIKNFVVYGNPIFPFVLPCWGPYATQCLTGASFFGTWTTTITLSNAYSILKNLLAKNVYLHIILLLTPFFMIFNKSAKTRLIYIFLISSVFLELLMLRIFSGFLIRYHQHIQFFLITMVVIQLANKYTDKVRAIMIRGLYIILTFTVLASFAFTINHTNSLKFLNWYEINYSIGKIDIYDWINWKFPAMKSVIHWCENSPDGEKRPLARFDPDMIWYTYGGFMRSFMTSCYYANPPLEGLPPEKVLDVSKEKKLQFWIGTPKKCVADEEIKPTRPDIEDDHKRYLRHLNNLIICNSEQVMPSLYYFDYQRLE